MPPALAFINPRLSTRNVGDHFIEDSVKRILAFDKEVCDFVDLVALPDPADLFDAKLREALGGGAESAASEPDPARGLKTSTMPKDG